MKRHLIAEQEEKALPAQKQTLEVQLTDLRAKPIRAADGEPDMHYHSDALLF